MGFKKATGSRGSWFATVDGRTYACVHQHWFEGKFHDDPGHDPVRYPQFKELADAIQADSIVIMTRDEVTGDDMRNLSFTRLGYVGLFKIANFEIRDGHMKFELAERLCDLR